MFPYAKWVFVIGTIGRLLLVFISLRKPSICKSYFYYDLAMIVFNQCLVKDAGGYQDV